MLNRPAIKCFALLAALFSAFPAVAAFNSLDYSARSFGMGSAFVAIADDISALHSNPSGTGGMKNWEALFTYNKLMVGAGDIGESYAAAVYPLKGVGSLGLSWYSFGDTVYSESAYQLSFAFSHMNSSAGVNVKYLSKGYASNEWTAANSEFFTSLSKSVLSFGFSFHTRFLNDFTAGFFIDDFNSPDIGLMSEEKLPVSLKGGLAFRQKDSTFGLEFVSRGGLVKFLGGAEISGFKAGDFGSMSFRLGAGMGSGQFFCLTAGTGIKFSVPFIGVASSFDYGFMLPFNFAEGTGGTHKFTLSFAESYDVLKKSKETDEGLKIR